LRLREGSSPVILGIDPGLASTGFGAIVSGLRPVLLRCGYIKTPSRMHISGRLTLIHSDLMRLIEEVGPSIVAIESIYSSVKYPRAGILLGGVMGVVYLAASLNSIPVVEFAPKTVKNSLTGWGGAGKRQLGDAVRKTLNMEGVGSLHASDALAVALTAYARRSLS